MTERHPAAILMDIDFAGQGCGLRLAEEVQNSLEQKLPLLFFSQEETDTLTRLAAVRAGGREFFTGMLDASSLPSTCTHQPAKVAMAARVQMAPSCWS